MQVAFTEYDYGDTADLPGSPILGQRFQDKQADVLYACFDTGVWQAIASDVVTIDASGISLDDNINLTLGTGGDADLYFDGLDVVLDPRIVGTGNVQVLSSLLVGAGWLTSRSSFVADEGGSGMEIVSVTGAVLRLTSTTNMSANERVGEIQFYGNDASTSASNLAGSYGLYADTSWTNIYPEGKHEWWTADGTTVSARRMTLSKGGNLYLNATAKLYLDGSAMGGDSYLLEEASNQISIYANGARVAVWAPTAIKFQQAYTQTTGNAANMTVSSDGSLKRSTSSIRYKHDIQGIDLLMAKDVISNLRPVTYRGKTDEDQREYAGFVAEEVVEINPMLVTFDEEGHPDYVTYDRVPAYLVPVVQDLMARVDALERS